MAIDEQAKQAGSTSQNSGGAAAGIAAHHAKFARHHAQLQTKVGRMTGGLATSVGVSPTLPPSGKFYTKGKH